MYTLRSDGSVTRDADGAVIPPDPSNADWQSYEAWVAAGNTAGPALDSPLPPRMQLGTVFLGAIADLGWWPWMDQGAAVQATAGKPLDQRYWLAIGKADLVLLTDAKLNRVARAAEAARVAASGQPAPAAPVITMTAAMDHGDAITAAA